MRWIPLASSSAGNAYILDDGATQILLECGLGPRKLQKQIRGAGYRLTEMAACLVSHEHKDHARCVGRVMDYGIPVWCSAGTAEALDLVNREGFTDCQICAAGQPFSVGTLDVLPFQTFHDAQEPLGFLIRSQVDGDKLAFATDTVNLRYRFPGLNVLAIEANYSDTILSRQTRMPEKVVHRIRNSHMAIETLCGYLSGLPLEHCREIYLLHLSDACSDEGWFLEAVRRVVPAGVKVTACPKERDV